MKYSKGFKLECIQKYKNKEYLKDPPGVNHKIFLDQVRKWARIYDFLGESGIEHNKPTLTLEQRLELFNKVEDRESYRLVADSVGIGNDLLIKWHNIYRQKGIDGYKSLKRGRKPMTNKTPKKEKNKSELEQIKEELEYLRAENAYLKKLNTLVQKRKAQPQKKK